MLKRTEIRRAAALTLLVGGLLLTIACGGANPPKATYAYVLSNNFGLSSNATSVLSQFKMENDGTLTPLTPPTLPVDGLPEFVTADPAGRYLFIYGDTAIQQFAIGADGTLSANSVPIIGRETAALTFSPSGQFALAGVEGSIVISYRLDRSGLTPISIVPSPVSPGALAFDPTGAFAYIGPGYINIPGCSELAEYSVSSSGELNLFTTYSTEFCDALTLSPAGFLYASNGAGSVGEFSIKRPDGSLSMVNSLTGAPTAFPWNQLTFGPAGEYAYVNQLSSIASWKVDSTSGALSTNGTPTLTGSCSTCWGSSIAVDPSGRFMFQAGSMLLNQSGSTAAMISRLQVNADGTLTPDGVMALTGQAYYPGQFYPQAITVVNH